jgi:hypothetical protein
MLIRVNKISVKQFNQLVDLGYTVAIAQTAAKPVNGPYIRYKYMRPIKPFKPIKPLVRIIQAKACTCQHIS